jgi:hypothetical protein
VTRGPEGTTVRFDATSWRLERTHCGSASDEYALDHFSGRLDVERQEFTSINTYSFGGGESFQDPTLFRRVQCAPREVSAPRVTTVVRETREAPAAAAFEATTSVVFVCAVSVAERLIDDRARLRLQ